MKVSKVIQSSLGSTTQTLDRPTATGPNARTKALVNRLSKTTSVLKAPKVPRPAMAPPPKAPKDEASSGKHVEIVIKLLVPK